MPSFKRLAMNLAMGIVAGLLVAVILVRLLEHHFIYFPPRYPDGFIPPENYGLALEEAWMTTTDGIRLNAWFLLAPSSPRVILWFHGNAENIGYGLAQLKAFSRLGANVLAVDYRGFGKSQGSPDEAGIYQDAETAYRYLVESKHFEPRNVFVYGHSLGGAVAIDLAARRECGGLIAESTFTTGREMARRMFRIPFFEYVPRTRFDSLGKIAKVRAPILIIHGTGDAVVPFEMGKRLAQAAPQPKSLLAIEGAGHDDVYLIGGEAYAQRLRDFIGGLRAESARAPSRPKEKEHEVR
jgi:hypothetical protein